MTGHFTLERLIALLFEGVSLLSPGMTTGDRVSPSLSGRSYPSMAGWGRCLALPAGQPTPDTRKRRQAMAVDATLRQGHFKNEVQRGKELNSRRDGK